MNHGEVTSTLYCGFFEYDAGLCQNMHMYLQMDPTN